MPELPEVEALVRLLGERSSGAVVERCQLGSVSALKTFDPPLDAICGRTVAAWHRRGKYLEMDTGGLWLVLNLARAGWVNWWEELPRGRVRPGARGPVALRVSLHGDRGFDVTEMGTEKRLAVWVVHDPAEIEGVATLGPEPLVTGFSRDVLARLLSGEKGTLKRALSRQSLVAGIGNAYSDEILHAARLSPFKPASSLSGDELHRLHEALRSVLAGAVERAVGLDPPRLKGDKKRSMRVHGRTGEQCPVCGDVVREVSFATRSLQYCATCQTGGKPLADRRLSRLVK